MLKSCLGFFNKYLISHHKLSYHNTKLGIFKKLWKVQSLRFALGVLHVLVLISLYFSPNCNKEFLLRIELPWLQLENFWEVSSLHQDGPIEPLSHSCLEKRFLQSLVLKLSWDFLKLLALLTVKRERTYKTENANTIQWIFLKSSKAHCTTNVLLN